MLYMLFEGYKHEKHLKFGHEASLACVVGLIISAIMWYQNFGDFSDMMSFNDNLFFYVVLPPIVFQSGFNMYQKKFFANIQNVLLFGVVSTFCCFTMFSGFTMLANDKFNMSQYTYDVTKQKW